MCWHSKGLDECADEMFHEEHKCEDCENKDEVIGDVKYYFLQLMCEMYGKSEINVNTLDTMFCEISDRLNIKVPDHAPTIARENSTVGQLQYLLETMRK